MHNNTQIYFIYKYAFAKSSELFSKSCNDILCSKFNSTISSLTPLAKCEVVAIIPPVGFRLFIPKTPYIFLITSIPTGLLGA